MKKLILISTLLTFLLLPALCFSGSIQDKHRAVIAAKNAGGAVACSASTDLIGNSTNEASSNTGTADRIYINRYQATVPSGCSVGTIATAYIYHATTNTDNAKVCIWNSTDTTPNASDTLVICSAEITGSANVTWYNNVINSGAVTAGNWYWVGVIFDATTWEYLANASAGTMYYKTVAGSYASPPSLETSFANTTRQPAVYFTIGP